MSAPGREMWLRLLQGQPRTYKAMQQIVSAAADAVSSQGKKSLLGADKGLAADRKLMQLLTGLPAALRADGLISAGTPFPIYLEQVARFLDWFERAYPNWPEAYGLLRAMLRELGHQEGT